MGYNTNYNNNYGGTIENGFDGRAVNHSMAGPSTEYNLNDSSKMSYTNNE
jgi:hypothetical protein